jgi:hypothetical protein
MIPYDILWVRLQRALDKQIKDGTKALRISLKDGDYANAFALWSERNAIDHVRNVIMKELEGDKQ